MMKNENLKKSAASNTEKDFAFPFYDNILMPKFTINERYDYQRGILNYLKDYNGYMVRTNADFDRRYAIDGELLIEFLTATQPKKVEALRKMYKGDFEETLFNYLNQELNRKDGSLIATLKHGFDRT